MHSNRTHVHSNRTRAQQQDTPTLARYLPRENAACHTVPYVHMTDAAWTAVHCPRSALGTRIQPALAFTQYSAYPPLTVKPKNVLLVFTQCVGWPFTHAGHVPHGAQCRDTTDTNKSEERQHGVEGCSGARRVWCTVGWRHQASVATGHSNI